MDQGIKIIREFVRLKDFREKKRLAIKKLNEEQKEMTTELSAYLYSCTGQLRMIFGDVWVTKYSSRDQLALLNNIGISDNEKVVMLEMSNGVRFNIPYEFFDDPGVYATNFLKNKIEKKKEQERKAEHLRLTQSLSNYTGLDISV